MLPHCALPFKLHPASWAPFFTVCFAGCAEKRALLERWNVFAARPPSTRCTLRFWALKSFAPPRPSRPVGLELIEAGALFLPFQQCFNLKRRSLIRNYQIVLPDYSLSVERSWSSESGGELREPFLDRKRAKQASRRSGFCLGFFPRTAHRISEVSWTLLRARTNLSKSNVPR